MAMYGVSVPLRGLWFLSLAALQEIEESGEDGFRPLAGIMVLIVEGKYSSKCKLGDVSVPLRGLWFLSPEPVAAYINEFLRRFRPLAGIMVLIRCFLL